MTDGVTHTWVFGGPLAGTPLEVAWTILAVVAGACAVVAWVSYRTAVVRLGVAPSFLLMGLRMGGLLTLLFCLANPVRIERTTAVPPPPPSPEAPPPAPILAVVVDRSGSMTEPDNRGRTRLDDALVGWRRIEKVAETHFAPFRYFSVAGDMKPAANLEEALARDDATDETRLYESLATYLQESSSEGRPDALVVLTDGIDTTNQTGDHLRDAAVAAGVPVYFIPGTNRSARPDPFLRVREWRAPATVMRNSEFNLEAVFEAFSRDDRTERFSLWMGSQRVAGGFLSLTTGSNVVQHSFQMSAGEAGVVEFTLRWGDTTDSPVAARSVLRILDKSPIRVLVFQGALDWGFRHFTDALRTDPNFELTSIVTPDVGLTLSRSARVGGTELGRLPDTAEALEAYDCVVLARPYPAAWTVAQQQALIGFVRRGGSVLFMSPDPAAAAQFEQAAVGDLLPVRLERTATILRSALEGGGVGTMLRGLLQGSADDKPRYDLHPFALTEAGRASPVFMRAGGGEVPLIPKFVEYFPATEPKPGAEVLAVHPPSVDVGTGPSPILLATLNFGRGRTALLTTDALWRWKLSEPSDLRTVETFWQQLLLAIGRRSPPEALRFVNAPPQVRLGETVALMIAGLGEEVRPAVAAKSPSNQVVQLRLSHSGDPDAPWHAEWTPDEPGAWELVAVHEKMLRAHAFPSVTPDVVGERARTMPSLDVMSALAGETGGALLIHEAPAAWRRGAESVEATLESGTSERMFLRWNTWMVLGLALGFYSIELILRRLWRLL